MWIINRLRGSAGELFTRYRILIALKASIAAIGAWLVGQLLPGELGQYAYYAPLGALLGVMPTVVDSIRTSVELIVGIALGVLVGWLLIATQMPWFLRAPIAAGLGVWLAGIHRLGAGRVYVAIAAVFVVISGANDPESYGVGYVTQFALGLCAGTIVNLLLLPPLGFASASARVAVLQSDLAEHINDIADVLEEDWPPDARNWLSYARELRKSVEAVEELVDEARRSSKINPRALWHRSDLGAEYAAIDRSWRMGLRLSEITQVLSGVMWNDPVPAHVPNEIIFYLRDMLRDLANYVNAHAERRDATQSKEDCIRSCERVVAYFADDNKADSGLGTLVFSVRMIQATLESVDEN